MTDSGQLVLNIRDVHVMGFFMLRDPRQFINGVWFCVCGLSRSLLCNLVRVKLTCYEREGKNTLSLEDYLKAFMETEVKPLWPKGWMQARCVAAANVILLLLLLSDL